MKKSNLMKVAELISKLERLGLVNGNYTFNQINPQRCNFAIFNLKGEDVSIVLQKIEEEFSEDRKYITGEDGTISCHIY